MIQDAYWKMFEFVTHWGNFDFSGLEIDFFICLNLIINGVTDPLEAGASSKRAEGP